MAAYVAAPADDATSVNLQFKNLTAYLKFTIGYKCKSVTVTAPGDVEYLSAEKLILSKNESGEAVYNGSYAPKNSVTLTGENGAAIMPGTYYIAVLPGKLSTGFTMTFTSAIDDTKTLEKSTTKEVTLKRNTILNLGTIDITSFKDLKGSGTSADPYLINDYCDLMVMQERVNAGTDNGKYCSAYYQQTADIDFEGQELTSIGNASYEFEGTYDGNLYTISNVCYNSDLEVSVNSKNCIVRALFGIIHGATIENLKIENASYHTYSIRNLYYCLSPLVGCASYRDDQTNTIRNCTVSNSTPTELWTQVCGFYYGGIVGFSASDISISMCTNKTSVNFTDASGSENDLNRIGGIIGWAESCEDDISKGEIAKKDAKVIIAGCRNEGTFSIIPTKGSENDLGGILGFAKDNTFHDPACNITSCVNSGTLTVANSGCDADAYMGGIIGYLDSDGSSNSEYGYPYVKNCLNKGIIQSNVSGDAYLGGIIGRCYDNKTTIAYCVNTTFINGSAISGNGYGSCSNNYTTVSCSNNDGCTIKTDLTAEEMDALVPDGFVIRWWTKDGTIDLQF